MADGTAFSIVGIGASAGGLEALTELVAALPERSGLTLIIVQHMPENQPSMLHEILAGRTKVAVSVLKDRDHLEPDHIYVLPAAGQATFRDAHVSLTRRASNPRGGPHRPIDLVFKHLAETFGSRSTAVVLSGTGSDGTSGARGIKEAGGVLLAQRPDTARFQSMPDSVIATGLADFVMTPAEIALKLVELADNMHEIDGTTDSAELDLTENIGQILRLLADRTGHNFFDYKTGTLARRVLRRMLLGRHRNVADYLDKLDHSEAERHALVQDFLIGVTRFFRDPESYDVLARTAIPWLLRSSSEQIRVWVPGCSTGEEVYSLAILISEEMDRQGIQANFKVFGTDVDLEALHRARLAQYSADNVETVPPHLRAKYFTQDGRHFHVATSLREKCVIAPHNILVDPPFSRMGLISFKNVLIYLDMAAQARLMPRLHYALSPEGYLALGPSESISGDSAMFDVIDRKNRIFRRSERVTPKFSALDTPIGAGLSAQVLQSGTWAPNTIDQGIEIEPRVEQEYLMSYASPFAVIGADYSILYLSERMGDFIRPAKGAVVRQLDRLLIGELRAPVHAVLAEARAGSENAEERNVIIPIAGERRTFDILARTSATDAGSVFIILKEVRVRDFAASNGEAVDIARKETELARNRVRALETNYAASEQKLRSANEELLSMNEELQSSNEELDTSREELQSINEELETINAELTETNSKLSRTVNNLENMMQSSGLAKIFVDIGLSIRLFTPEAKFLFGILERDIGRPFADISSRLNYPQMLADIAQVISSESPLTREVQGPDDIILEARLKPYRTTDRKLDGCVLIFVDVTDLRRAADTLGQKNRLIEQQISELNGLYNHAPVGLALVDPDLRFVKVNSVLAQMNGTDAESHIGRHVRDILPELADVVEPVLAEVLKTGEPVFNREIPGTTASFDGDLRNFIASYARVEAEGEIIGIAASVQDVTEFRQLERDLQIRNAELTESEAHLQRLFDNAPVIIAYHEGPEHRYLYSNKLHDTALGERDLIGKSILEAAPELKGQGIVERFDRVLETGEQLSAGPFEAKLNGPDGMPHSRHYIQTLQPWFRGDKSVGGVMSFAVDVTDMIEAQSADRAKSRFLAHMSHELPTPLNAILGFSDAVTSMRNLPREKIWEYVDDIHTAGIHLLALINDVLDLSRIESDTMELRLEAINVGEAADIALSTIHPIATEKSQVLSFDNTVEDLVLADPRSLHQCLLNLLSNAVKFTPPQGMIGLEIRPALLASGDPAIAFAVTDNGPGIPEDLLSQLGQPFVTGSVDHANSQGTGLGLAITKALAMRMGGTLDIQSTLDKGTRMTLLLPRAK